MGVPCQNRNGQPNAVQTGPEKLPHFIWCLIHYSLFYAFNTPFIKEYAPYGNTGCGVFKRGIQNQKDFCLRINIPKGNF